MKLEIDQHRLLAELETLSSFSDAAPPAVTRVVFTPSDLRARTWLISRCEEAGLTVRQDAIGNIFARWNGAVGVLGGLEALRALRRAGFRPKNSLELLAFATEEPTRFGIGCLGSRLLSGTLSADAAGRLTDRDVESLDEVRRKAGLHGNLKDVKLPTGYYKAFLELHIEQGPLLERTQTPLGI